MRPASLLVISVLPLLAQPQQGPVSAMVANASVLFGPGIIQDRSGETPAPRFEPKLSVEVNLEGLNPKAKPRFRFWLVKAADEPRLNHLAPGSTKAKILSTNPGIKTAHGYAFEMRWPKGSVDPEDRLFVEIFLGRRRAAQTASNIQAHYLPASHPRGHEENK